MRAWVCRSSSSPSATSPVRLTRRILTCRCSPGCCGSGRTAIVPSPRSAAQGFADHLNGVLNRSVSDARLTILAVPGYGDQFTIACLDGPRAAPFALFGSSLRLLLSQTVEVVEGRCHTVTYAYRLATGDAKNDWLVRWEYFRRPPRPDYPYPLAHAHVNATLLVTGAEDLLAKPTPHLHLPTARLPLELVLWHLIAEWGVHARTSDWRAVLQESLAGFEERRSAM